MSRSGYSDDDEGDGRIAMWRGQVASASRGKRGQKFFRDLIEALDAMPEKRLVTDALIKEGEVCALGALGLKRGIPIGDIDPEDPETVAAKFDIAHQLAAETAYMNDEAASGGKYVEGKYVPETPERRWGRMRAWAVANLKPGGDKA